jgi:copper chaperone
MSTTTTNLAVTGMTCGHCVSSVTEELGAIDGVESVTVELNVGGVSVVTVASTTDLDPAAVRAAVDEAGYSLQDA